MHIDPIGEKVVNVLNLNVIDTALTNSSFLKKFHRATPM
jgi:hypothetical protein